MEQYMQTSPHGTDPWSILETEFRADAVPGAETIFSTANGYLGIRGAFEERTPSYHPGTYINGIYETKPIIYGEGAYGFAKNSQTILNLTDAGIIQLYVDENLFDLAAGRVLEYRRRLDLREGYVERNVVWESPAGKRVRMTVRRMVSFTRRHLAVFDWSCSLLEGEAVLTVLTIMNGAVRNLVGFDDPRVGAAFKDQVLEIRRKKAADGFSQMCSTVRNSGFTVACSALDSLRTENRYAYQVETDRHRIVNRYVVNAKADAPIGLARYISYYTSRDAATTRLGRLSKHDAYAARELGASALFDEQRRYLEDFWKRADIRIEGDDLMNVSLRFNTFHILQGTGTNGFTNAPAKGLSGEGYEGHYFWDSEIYILPLFAYVKPEIARKMLEYRYHMLDKARERAAELSHRGALFPWRTINGEEASAYFPAGTAQYHINADIVFAVKKYVEVSGDTEFLRDYGAEILLETARFWLTLGDYIKGRGFCINTVTGPDEYNALVNNNAYTNLMAKMNLQYAASVLEGLKESHPVQYARIVSKTGFREEELDAWRRAASAMYIPFDRELGIYAQDDSFLTRARWNFEAGKGKHPLLLHFHPLNIYRYQMLKQPDLVLAQFLLGNQFSSADKKRNFDYYDPLVTGDSSLGPCIQSVMCAELGYLDEAYRYFMKTARMDLDNIAGNVRDGVHMAAMAGTWTALIFGFAGLRDYDGTVSFRPSLPPGWTRLTFRLTVRGNLLEADVRPGSVRYTLVEGSSLSFRHAYRELRLHAGGSVEVETVPVLRAVIVDGDSFRSQELAGASFSKFLDACRKKSLRTAYVSEKHASVSGEAAVPFFSVTDGSRLRKGKPDPELFLDACDALRVLPGECVVITSDPAGLRAAESGRIPAIGIGVRRSCPSFGSVDDLDLDAVEKLFPEIFAERNRIHTA